MGGSFRFLLSTNWNNQIKQNLKKINTILVTVIFSLYIAIIYITVADI